MYLKSIEVQGFKSFANKIKFEFHNGITGIVGPNGSGKSNVADAVRWVLGEQRVKQLRGGTMQDVIFSGTENRKPLSYASVAITLDNSDHKLPVEYEEVTVTRKLYRSGESEYLINGSACRLKDINEMFYDTGIGKEGYSIIGQGQIDKILSGKPEDLIRTDHAAMACIDPTRRGQDMDNYNWIRDAEKNRLVVGTQARILYQDAEGRLKIALEFNRMVRDGEVGPIMLGRDHHDVSGTDSPFRETSNIRDGSNVMADMAVQCFAGNAARGMSLVALHNGGGVGIGKAINGGFGMVLDGSERVDEILRSAMIWDVMGGVARRSWARNSNAMRTSATFNENRGEQYHITLPYIPERAFIHEIVQTSLNKKV